MVLDTQCFSMFFMGVFVGVMCMFGPLEFGVAIVCRCAIVKFYMTCNSTPFRNAKAAFVWQNTHMDWFGPVMTWSTMCFDSLHGALLCDIFWDAVDRSHLFQHSWYPWSPIFTIGFLCLIGIYPIVDTWVIPLFTEVLYILVVHDVFHQHDDQAYWHPPNLAFAFVENPPLIWSSGRSTGDGAPPAKEVNWMMMMMMIQCHESFKIAAIIVCWSCIDREDAQFLLSCGLAYVGMYMYTYTKPLVPFSMRNHGHRIVHGWTMLRAKQVFVLATDRASPQSA